MADDLQDEIAEFEAHSDHWQETRTAMLNSLQFNRLGIQWDSKIEEMREKAGRPVLTINKAPSFARQVINEARRNKPSIKTHPADDKADVETAEIIDGLIRNIEYSSCAGTVYDTALEYAVYCGAGYFEVDIDFASYDQFDQDIFLRRITNPLSVYPDMYSVGATGEDWNRCWVTEMMDKKAFEAEYPGAEVVDWKGGSYDERWIDEDDIRIACRWSREELEAELVKLADGQIMLGDTYLEHKELFDAAGLMVVQQRPTTIFEVKKQIMTCSEILDEVDWPGRYIPVCPVFGEEFTVEGRRYFHGMFEHSMDSQKMYNYWRSATTELVALQPKAPFIGPKGAFDSDSGNWAKANIENHPYLMYDGDVAPTREAPPQIPQGTFQEAMSADMDMKAILNMYDPAMGDRKESEISGKAVREWRTGSDTANFHFMDNLSRALEYAGRVIIDLIPHVYSEQRIIRVLGLDGEPENVPIMQEYPDPKKQGAMRVNDFSIGRYDLTVQTGPSFTTRRQEALETMQSMVSSAPQLMGIIGDLIAKNMDWDGADEIAKRLKAMLPPQIAALENMEGIPEEARAHIAQAQGAVQNLTQQLQQKDGLLAEYDQATKQLKLQLEDKSGKLALQKREQDLEVMMKQADQRHEEKMEELKGEIKKELEILKDALEPVIHLYKQAG